MIVRLATPADAAAIAEIYAHYVRSTPISFETGAPDEKRMKKRIEEGGAAYPWLCAEVGQSVVGYAYASPFRPRPAYRYTVETSAYVAQGSGGRGIGGALYRRLIGLLEAQGFAQAIGAITLPNDASVRLHEALGFVRCGTYRQVGWKLGAWHDVGLWQRSLAPASIPPAEPKGVVEVWTA